MKQLSGKQLKVLGLMSTKAYKLLASTGAEDAPYDEWRHRFTQEVTGRASWKQLRQGDYIPLLNAYRRILGMHLVADNTPQDDKAAHIWKLKDRARYYEMGVAYVAAIAAGKFQQPALKQARTLDELCTRLDSHQVFDLYITVKARGEAKGKRDAARMGIPAATAAHASPSTMPPPRLAAARGDTLLKP